MCPEEKARSVLTQIVRELVSVKVATVGMVKTAIREIARETKISTAWLERVRKSDNAFAPLLQNYWLLCEALENELERQRRVIEEKRRALEDIRRDAAFRNGACRDEVFAPAFPDRRKADRRAASARLD